MSALLRFELELATVLPSVEFDFKEFWVFILEQSYCNPVGSLESD